MGFSMRVEKGKSYPVLTCDTCGEPIDNWGSALVAFLWPSEDSIVAAKLYHKGVCDPGGGARRYEETDDVIEQVQTHLEAHEASFWEELSTYIPWLLWNNEWGRRQTSKGEARVIVDVPRPLDIGF